MNKDWLVVFESLKSVYTSGAYSNIAINKALLHHIGCKESFVRNYAKGVLRDTIRLDYYIDRLATRGIKKVAARPLIVMRMGIYAIESLDSVPDYAAVSEAVSLAKKVAKGSEGFINGMLRSFIRERENLSIPEDRLDLKYSISEPIVSLLKNQYESEAEDILKGLNEPSKTVLRVNRLRAERDDVITSLNAIGIDADPSDESQNAVIASGSGIIASDLFKAGLISVQSLSSMLAIEALSPEPGSSVIDLCAAPGGKTAYMAELMDNRGSITACDIHEHRLALIKKTMERLGIGIVQTELSDGSVYKPDNEEQFDYVLADVPCSGLGVISSKPELRFRSNPEEYKSLIVDQRNILKNAISYVKPGGRILYSTCTLNKDENEKLIERVMGEEPGTLLKLLEMKTLMPYNCKVGFFYAVIEKTESVIFSPSLIKKFYPPES